MIISPAILLIAVTIGGSSNNAGHQGGITHNNTIHYTANSVYLVCVKLLIDIYTNLGYI